jgi:Xaa-Pro aminopeptidase
MLTFCDMGVIASSVPASAATVNGRPIPAEPDLGRMRRERSASLREHMRTQDVDALLLLGTSAVQYATGAPAPAVDASRATILRPVALVLADDPEPHLFTPYPEAAAGRISEDHVHPPLLVELDEACAQVAATLARMVPGDAVLAADEIPFPLRRALADRVIADGAAVLGASRILKTPDELACLRMAQWLNELAMSSVQPLLQPGVRQCELTGGFLSRAFELGASGIGIDTIWQVMPDRKANGPWAFHGDVAFPTPSTDMILREGDVIWVDSGIFYEGYASDFGRTWLVGAGPSEQQREQFQRWTAVMNAVLAKVKPGATGGDLCRAARSADPVSAAKGSKPWLEQFYLVHGLGVDSAEMPFFGTDLGEAFDGSFILAPGMVLVLEPVIWADGAGGYRSEDLVVVTDDGWAPLSDYPYAPFEAAGPLGAPR